MGSVHTAECECGFSRDVTVGGGRHTFLQKSLFPFYCKSCGLVEVNIAVLPDKVFEAPCPTCGAAGTVQYGVPPVSQHDMRQKPKRFWQRQEPQREQAVLHWRQREASESGHICPACHKMTLKFSQMPSLMFD